MSTGFTHSEGNVLNMRYDNWAAQRRWNRMAARSEQGRKEGSYLYGLAAALVSLIWIPGLAVCGSFNERIEGDSFLAHLHDWAIFIPGFTLGGVSVAFLFRKHMREASWLVASVSAVVIGMIASSLAAIPYVWTAVFGPIVFVTFWKVTLPLSWFSFWAMRTVDRRLRRNHA